MQKKSKKSFLPGQKPHILLLGNYGAGNLGDEAILTALIQEFSRDYTLTVMSGNPAQTQQTQGVEAVPFWPSGLRSTLKAHLTREGRAARRNTRGAFEQADLVVLGGGTLITDVPRKALWIWRCQVKEALRHGKPVWLYRGGIGPLNHWSSRRWVRWLLRRLERVVVRDERSREWTQRLGRKTVELQPDPVMDLTLASTQKSKREGVILALRNWTKNENNLVEIMAKFVRYLALEKGKKIRVVFFEKGNKKDIELVNKIFEQAKVGNAATVTPFNPSLPAMLETLSSAEHLIGMRLHSLILAEKTSTPYTGIAYSEKVMGFLESIHKADQGIPLETLTYETLVETYNRSAKDRSKS